MGELTGKNTLNVFRLTTRFPRRIRNRLIICYIESFRKIDTRIIRSVTIIIRRMRLIRVLQESEIFRHEISGSK